MEHPVALHNILILSHMGLPNAVAGDPVALSKKRASTCHLVHGDRNPLEGPDISNEDLFFYKQDVEAKNITYHFSNLSYAIHRI